MRLMVLIIATILVVFSLSITLIQNFYPGYGTATTTGSGFTFVRMYAPSNNDSFYKVKIPEVRTTPATTPVAPVIPATEKVYIDPTVSTYKDKVIISSVSGGSSNASDESLSLSNTTASEDVDITGFTIENSIGEKILIPKGYNLPGYGTTPGDEIILSSRGTAIIRMGKQERQMNFRENLCTGYFNQSSDFNGVLSQNCPRPDVLKMLNLNDQCINTLNSIPNCRTMGVNEQINYECNQFVNEHYSYVGCVNDFQSRKDFYTNNWLIWMQRSGEFFRNLREKIVLKDQSGKIVDEFSY